MRNLILALAGTAAAVAFAAPASAQYYPAPSYGYQPQYGYPTQYGYPVQYGQPGYGYQNNWLYDFRNNRYAAMMRDRVHRIRGDIRNMAARRVLSRGEFISLDNEARRVERKIDRSARYGVDRREARNIDRSVRRLEERVIREANDWNRRAGVRRYNPYNYNQYWTYYGNDYGSWNRDRDHDGRDDNAEHDRWHDQHDRD